MKLVSGTAMGCSGCRFGPGLAFLLALAAGSAEGQEFCVACSDPPGIYRCVIDGAQPRGGQSLQMLCVTAMAKEGGHATCSVKRGTVFDCGGAHSLDRPGASVATGGAYLARSSRRTCHARCSCSRTCRAGAGCPAPDDGGSRQAGQREDRRADE